MILWAKIKEKLIPKYVPDPDLDKLRLLVLELERNLYTLDKEKRWIQ